MIPIDFDEREGFIDTYFKDLQAIENDLLTKLKVMIRSKEYTDTELSKTLATLNFLETLDGYDFSKVTQDFLDKYDDTLQQLKGYAESNGLRVSAVTIRELDDLINLETDVILKRADAYGAELKRFMVRSLVGGTDRRLIAQQLESAVPESVKFNSHMARVATSQAFTAFRAVTLDKVMSSQDNEVRYRLIHPFDDNTRHRCKVAIAIDEKNPDGFTSKHIDGGALGDEYTFENLGGFNCRGDWLPVIDSLFEDAE